jgi:hypothetical protein
MRSAERSPRPRARAIKIVNDPSFAYQHPVLSNLMACGTVGGNVRNVELLYDASGAAPATSSGIAASVSGVSGSSTPRPSSVLSAVSGWCGPRI